MKIIIPCYVCRARQRGWRRWFQRKRKCGHRSRDLKALKACVHMNDAGEGIRRKERWLWYWHHSHGWTSRSGTGSWLSPQHGAVGVSPGNQRRRESWLWKKGDRCNPGRISFFQEEPSLSLLANRGDAASGNGEGGDGGARFWPLTGPQCLVFSAHQHLCSAKVCSFSPFLPELKRGQGGQ